MLDGIAAALEAGLAPVKVNAVVQRGVNDHTIPALLERFRGTPVIVRLIEYMDVGNRNHWDRAQVVPSAELLERISALWPLTPQPGQYRGEVAERYSYDDGAGEIGFISSISAPFCGACSRVRLSSEGDALHLSLRNDRYSTCAACCVAAPPTRRSPRGWPRSGPRGTIATANSARCSASGSASFTR